MSVKHHHHTGNLLILDAIAAHSGLVSVSPVLKAAFSFLCLLLCVGAEDVVVGVVVACSMLGIIWKLGKVPFCQILSLIKIPITFLVISCVVILVELTAAPIGFLHIALTHNHWLCVSAESLHHSVTIFFQSFGAVSCLYFLATATPMPQLIDVLHKCHLPEMMIELMYLIYRYLFVLLDVQKKMTISASARLGYEGVKTSIRTAGLISGGVLGSSFRRCGANLDAMEARCYDGKLAFLTHIPRFQLKHGLAALGYILLLGFLVLIRKGIIL